MDQIPNNPIIKTDNHYLQRRDRDTEPPVIDIRKIMNIISIDLVSDDVCGRGGMAGETGHQKFPLEVGRKL